MVADRQKLMEKAERLASRGKLNAAIAEFMQVIDAYPDDTSTLNRIGDLYVRLKRIDDAIELFRQAAEHFEQQGFFVKAIAIYKKILRIDTSQLQVSESLADLQHRQGLASDARRQYEAVADAYVNRGDIEAAINVHRKLIEVDPDDPGHRLHLADLLKQNDRIPEAMGQYKGIADFFLSHGKAEEAVKVCLEALALAPQNTDFAAGVARELSASGYMAEAENFVKLASEQNEEISHITLQAPSAEIEEAVGVEDKEEAEVEEVEAEIVEATEVDQGDVDVEVEVEPEDEQEEVEFEIDLGDIEIEEEAEAEEAEVEEEVVVELEADEPDDEPVEEEVVEAEEAVVEEEPEEVPVEVAVEASEDEGLKELLIEADVLARYGLEDKAVEKLEEIIDAAPNHFASYQTLISLRLKLGDLDRVAELAMMFRPLAEETDQADQWEALQSLLGDAGFVIEDERVVAPEPVVVEPESEGVEAVDGAAESGVEDLSWLDEVTTEKVATGPGQSEVFESEEEFFDLASELERELDSENLEMSPDEQSIEEIVEGFRRGMAETLSVEDYDTHYNLGIAYREMGLVDEAISEFQLASKDMRYLVDCCSLLATCFVEKGFPELAIKWYNEGLSSPTISQEEVLGLQYELGDLYLDIGETEEAKQRFVEIYGVNSDYRDVSNKLAALEQPQA